MTSKLAAKIQNAIRLDLCDRSGFDIDALDRETRAEIARTWRKLIDAELWDIRLALSDARTYVELTEAEDGTPDKLALLGDIDALLAGESNP